MGSKYSKTCLENKFVSVLQTAVKLKGGDTRSKKEVEVTKTNPTQK